MIDKQTVDKILDAAQIVDVVSDFVTLRKRGVNYIGLCPFHDEKTGSFTVSSINNSPFSKNFIIFRVKLTRDKMIVYS